MVSSTIVTMATIVCHHSYKESEAVAMANIISMVTVKTLIVTMVTINGHHHYHGNKVNLP